MDEQPAFLPSEDFSIPDLPPPLPYIRCLFCETGREHLVCRSYEALHLGRAIFPQKVKRLRHGKTFEEEYKPFLPGYVYVYCNNPIPYQEVRRIPHVLRILRETGNKEGYLQAEERELPLQLLDCGGVVGLLKAVQVGSWVQITDPLLDMCRGKVLKVDHRKQMAKLQLNVAGCLNNVWLSYDCLREENPLPENEGE